MKIVLQRVKHASVTVNGSVIGKIGAGLLVLAGLGKSDCSETIRPAIEKIINMRIFSNDKGKFDFSVKDLNGEILLVPQFTLFADTNKGRRPEFFNAMPPKAAEPLFLELVEQFKKISGLKVECGEFGADMKVELLNDGPVTITFDTEVPNDG